MTDPYDLERFVTAQAGIDDRALDELRRGHKASHWMWFVFPQITGLGRSPMAQRYAISGIEEARAYLLHPVLGPRLLECAAVLNAGDEPSAVVIFGSVDAQKLRSCMTLFHRAEPDEPVFGAVLDRFFGGVADPATDHRL